ncbi:MAG TPA: RNA 2',3'-cyclic phosphodiesterase [Pyrinomonadaceae bacterium]|nr:RNA 2',3'-cyclic phosphodiesterase [Pyrinomonadaceae bacterium]
MNTENTDRTRQWRMFCAFELPAAVRSRIDEHSRQVREAAPDAAASWSRPENIHLTMKFFGNVDQAQVPVITAAAARVVKEFSAIQIEVGKTGVFPRPSRPQVLWIGIDDPSGALLKLQQRLEDEFALEGFAKEDRAFRPHLTIARIRRPQNANKLAEVHLDLEFSAVAVRMGELILFRSELSPKGSKYTAISRHRLER